jgi:hypothetical protein
MIALFVLASAILSKESRMLLDFGRVFFPTSYHLVVPSRYDHLTIARLQGWKWI